MRVVLWGTYDTGKPRMRILARGLAANGVAIVECHRDVWRGIEDKSQVGEWSRRLGLLVRWLAAYPWLIACYLRAPKHDAVVVGYLGHLDVLVLWPFAKLRGVPVVWDAFLSLYNTVVEDRRLVSGRNPAAWVLYAFEWLACRAADRVVLDTRAHAAYFADVFRLPAGRCDAVWVGAEPEAFPPAMEQSAPRSGERIVLFYGQFIPLHGIDTIIHAARLTHDERVRWVLIGSGQEAGRVRSMLEASPAPNVQWLPWVEYRELADWILRANVCLGIFGDTDKAARVIPNKVFQILMSGKPLITRDSPAIRELLEERMQGVRLIPAADARALADAVRESVQERPVPALHAGVRERIAPERIGRKLHAVICSTLRG
jgi:glycosyltransferase involved in cell wall biosynthesis